ncbi:M20/M25/M40 family metallo-hydrolase [Tranquillimonas alkanivorans]|uniref:Putative aminopeptidase FrvX n=1 Tax=Tranquillimonas alkanivorans TaxID=441119 RepID=A0A1I5V7R6_9RHOB|nr:M20/M25/M40 family metallo-hydrolase [Tranquillimonas alkanivorans]SFQ03549.1 Putative aminopeptidase FrvX [Tranquillimonas alkanivorans]
MTGSATHRWTCRAPTGVQVERALRRCDEIRALVEAHVTPERMLRYVRALSDAPAPSGVASLMRTPVLRALLEEDGALGGRLALEANYGGTGAAALATGSGAESGLWYIAHLDTISYLVHPAQGGRHPLVPFCYHLTGHGKRPAQALRYDLEAGAFVVVAEGVLLSDGDGPSFVPSGDEHLRPGDRVVPMAPFETGQNGLLTGHFDNAGGVAALALAAPVLAEIGSDAFLAMPDEEEGPAATGNQSISRGSARLLAAAPAPRFSVVVDMQQTAAEGNCGPDGAGVPGAGAVLSEFSSLARGAVTPPPLYSAVREFARNLDARGATVKETSNLYTSRSDDVSVMQRNSDIVLLGFPGADRHFDTAYPTAHLDDLVSLSRALVYMSALAAELEEEP